MRYDSQDGYYIGGHLAEPGNLTYRYIQDVAMTNGYKCIIEVKAGVVTAVKEIDENGHIINLDIPRYEYAAHDKKLYLGCYADNYNNTGRYWKGTINKFKVWYGTLTEAEIESEFGVSTES